jgi:Protein of unknown function (DUF1826)
MKPNRRHEFGLTQAVHGRINDADCDLAVWIRRAPAAAKRFVRFCPPALLPDVTFNVGPGDDVRAPILVATTWPDKHAFAFANDVAMLADAFRAATGAKHLRIRVERVIHDGCRLFHVDRVKVRLVCTYRGAGTEWLTERNLMREGLKKGSNDAMVRHKSQVRHMRSWAVALLKGELANGTADAGVVHRSPPVTNAFLARLVVVIDDADVAYR